MKKRVAVMITVLAAIVALGLLPAMAQAAGGNFMPGTTGIEGRNKTQVWFGTYKQSGSKATGFNVDPIKWRVLSDNTKTLFLLSELSLDAKEFNESFDSVYWGTCTLRSWLNGYGADQNFCKKDFSSDNFLDTAFSAKEQAGIADTNVKIYVGDGKDTTDKVFLLAGVEASNTSYGFNGDLWTNDGARVGVNSDYANEVGPKHEGYAYRNVPLTEWWLRDSSSSLFLPSYLARVIDEHGKCEKEAYKVHYLQLVRPAINLNAESVLFTSAVGAKAASPGELVSVDTGKTVTEWKITLLDSSRSGFDAASSALNGNQLTVLYSGARTGSNEFLSMVITDAAGNYTYYSRSAALTAASGTYTWTLPSNLDARAKLYVFNEQYNGGAGDKTGLTDFASPMLEVSVVPQSHDVLFDTGSYCTAPAKQLVPDGRKVIKPADPIAKGYDFRGWYTDSSYNNEWNFDNPVTTGMTLYAKMVPGTYASNKEIMLGVGGIEGAQIDSIMYGTYKQSGSKAAGFAVEPVKWRVLSKDGGKLFLLSDRNLDVKPYNDSYAFVTWDTSTLKAWLNNTSAGFMGTAFTEKEQAGIADTADGKVFLLSVTEAENTAYGLSAQEARVALNTAYVAAGAEQPYIDMKPEGAADSWWLRSRGVDKDFAARVKRDGTFDTEGFGVDTTDIAVRPAMNLNQNTILFTSAASGGKDGTVGTIAGVDSYTGTEWRVTLLDSERYGFTAESLYRDGDKLGVSYAGAKTGADEYLSVLIVSTSGYCTHYGRIKALTEAAGTVEITLPSGVTKSNSLLLVFNEQYLGGAGDNTKLTDYVSVPVQLELEPVAYKVTFDLNGYSGTAPAYQMIPAGGKVTRPYPDPTHGIFAFQGWYKETGGTTPWNFGADTVNTDTKLWAKWDTGHTHIIPITVWINDSSGHWHECTGCHNRFDVAAHNPGLAATEAAPQTCTECGYVLAPALSHKGTLVPGVAATCMQEGKQEYYRCDNCGKPFEDADCTKEITNLATWGILQKAAHADNVGDGLCDTCDIVLRYMVDAGEITVYKGEEKDLYLLCNGNFADFTEMRVGGATLSTANYTARKGSTIVTLKKSYVATLPVGTHTHTFVYRPNGVASGNTAAVKVIVKERSTPTPTPTVTPTPTPTPAPTGTVAPTGTPQPTNTPKPSTPPVPATGDTGNTELWVILLALSLGTVIGLTIMNRRKKNR